MQHEATQAGTESRPVGSQLLKIAGVSLLALTMANCAKQSVSKTHDSREIGAFSDPKYGKASPRVVGLDEDAPKGGGRYQVGKPYMVAGKRYVPHEKPVGYTATGSASWYGVAFHGRKTANGEVYDRNSISAAHPTMPLPSYARVTNLRNRRSVVVRVNDRGPHTGGRIADVSLAAARALGMRTVAEGVETHEQLLELAQLQCDEVQGYFFGKPKPMRDLRINGKALIAA